MLDFGTKIQQYAKVKHFLVLSKLIQLDDSVLCTKHHVILKGVHGIGNHVDVSSIFHISGEDSFHTNGCRVVLGGNQSQ